MDTVEQRTAKKLKLEQLYVGRDIADIPKPAIVLDISKARRHCSEMLAAVEALGVSFRPHIKTHKVGYGHRLSLSVKSKRRSLLSGDVDLSGRR